MYHQIKPIPSSLNGLDPGAHNLSGLSVNGAVKCSRNQTDVKPRDLDESLPIPKLRLKYSAILVFIAALLCFGNSYDGNFVFDDRRAITENKDLLPQTPLSNLILNDFWGTRMSAEKSHKSYRPLTVLSFRLSYYLGDGLTPEYFHIPNILLHGIVSVLLLPVFSVLIDGHAVVTGRGQFQCRSPKSALLCALLFAVHPVHTENVSANVGRADLLCALLFLLSFMSYVKACAPEPDKNNKKAMDDRHTHVSVKYIAWSMVFCFLSVLSKEQGITVIGVCSVYDIVHVCRLDPLHLLGLRQRDHYTRQPGGDMTEDSKKSTNPWLARMIKRQVVLILSGSLILVFRCGLMGTTPPYFLPLDNPHSFQNGTFIRGLNYNYLYSLHSWLLLHPWWLCCDWSMGSVPVLESIRDPRILCVISFWAIVGVLLFKSLEMPITKDKRHIMIALSLMIIPFLPASNVFFRVGFVVAERILYLPSIGLCLLIVLGMRRICAFHNQYAKTIQWAVIILLLTYMIRCVQICYQELSSLSDGYNDMLPGNLESLQIRCVQRSSQWRDAMELYKSGETVCPLNAKIQFNIGRMAESNGHLQLAEEKYRLGLKLHPNNTGAMLSLVHFLRKRGEFEETERLLRRVVENELHVDYVSSLNNLGHLLAERGRSEEAEQYLSKAVKIEPTAADAWLNLGRVKKELKNYVEAERCYSMSLKYKPNNAKCYVNLGNLYLEVNQFDRAVRAWTNATILNPKLASAWANMASQLYVHGYMEESISVSEMGLKHLPNEPRLHFNLGNIYGIHGLWAESEREYLQAVQLNPNNALFYANLGATYAKWRKYDLAEENYRKALAKNPNEPNVNENLATLQKLRTSN